MVKNLLIHMRFGSNTFVLILKWPIIVQIVATNVQQNTKPTPNIRFIKNFQNVTVSVLPLG